jgi:hypothetical protein
MFVVAFLVPLAGKSVNKIVVIINILQLNFVIVKSCHYFPYASTLQRETYSHVSLIAL